MFYAFTSTLVRLLYVTAYPLQCDKIGINTGKFNPLTAKIFNFNFHPLEVLSRWRDPQLKVSENYSDLTK